MIGDFRIEYAGLSFGPGEIVSISETDQGNLANAALPVPTFAATVRSSTDLQSYTPNTPVLVWEGAVRRASMYLKSVDRAGPDAYKINAVSALEALARTEHRGGVYIASSVITLGALVDDICGSIPHIVKTGIKDIQLYGWLPYGNARDNLMQVCFAQGVTAKSDLDGVIRVEPLWNGVVGHVPLSDMYQGARVEYGQKITSLTLLEHAWAPGTEEVKLFEGTATAGDEIRFSEPMHSLTATGFTVQASGANWARISGGSGTLTGQKYVHTTRQIKRTVQSAPRPYEKVIDGATLVTLFNSADVADRLKELYAHSEEIAGGTIFRGLRPGNVGFVKAPYGDSEGEPATVSEAGIIYSGVDKSNMRATRGYVPPYVGNVDYVDVHDVVTGSGTYVFPADASSATVVLIGGGSSGGAGGKGADGEAGMEFSFRSTQGFDYPAGGQTAGGVAGVAGPGGKINTITLNLSSGRSFAYRCGAGGVGTSSASPIAGGDTVFGAYSSASGSVSATGYTDPVSGTRYAYGGDAGAAGGTGGAGGTVSASASNPGEYGGSVNVHPGGAPGQAAVYDHTGSAVSGTWRATAAVGGPGGGGASADANGGAASGSGLTQNGGNGAAGGKPAAKTVYGCGGDGGNGGGGGGSCGEHWHTAIYFSDGSYTTYEAKLVAGTGGAGGAGGNGAPGCIAIFYRRAIPKDSGAGVEKKNRFRLDRYGRITVT